MGRIHYELKRYPKAEAEFQKLVTGDDNLAAQSNLWLARVFSTGKQDYINASQILGSALTKYNNSELVDNIEFEYANSLMLKSPPEWQKL